MVLENLEAEQKFEKELANSRLEIQEQTFKNIAWELHDNVGQLLSVANIQLNMLEAKVDEEDRPQLEETKGIVGESLKEIRNLSRSLNKDVALNDGLVNSIKREIERFNRMNFLSAILNVEGEECCINPKDEIIIYRILQEFFSNVIKHAKADKLFVTLNFEPQRLLVKAQDDGVGFSMTDVQGSVTENYIYNELAQVTLKLIRKRCIGSRIRIYWNIITLSVSSIKMSSFVIR